MTSKKNKKRRGLKEKLPAQMGLLRLPNEANPRY